MVDVEFFGNFSCKRINFDDFSQLVVVNFRWLATMLIFKALVSFAKLLGSLLPWIFVSSSWARSIVDVAGCLCCFRPILRSNKKIALVCFLSNTTPIV